MVFVVGTLGLPLAKFRQDLRGLFILKRLVF